MPMKPIQVRANFQLDTSAARAQLQGLQRELNSITKNSSAQLGVTQQITEAIKAAELLKQTLSEATNINTGTLDLTKFTTSMRENMTSIEQMKKSLQSLGPEGEKAFNSLAMNIATAQVPLQRTSELFGQFKTAISNAMKWQISSMAIHKVTSEISKAFNYAKNLDKSLTNIQIVTGHNADYMAKFAQNANKAAQALSASTLEYTNASLIYYQQGLGDKEVAKRAETTLKLAKVTGESASKVSQQMTAVWNNFSNGVDNLERYADVMTALGATTASSSSEIAKGLEKFASVTKTIGLSYDYAASALATVTAQTRQSADSVGTAFKTLFSRLESLNLGETLDDSVTLNKYSEALLKVGVNVMDVNGHLKNMDNILDELGGRWDHLNKAQQVALAQTVGGVRNYTSLITLMDNWEDFQTNLMTSQLAEGTLQKQADVYAKSWEAAQQRVTTAAQGIYDTLISSDFFKGINNVTAFALNGISGMGRALGTGGSLAGLSMLINSAYKENLTTGINNLGNNILANTAYGQRQAINVKNDMLQQLNKDLTFNDSSLNIFRESLLKSATTVNDNFTKNYKTLPTRALQQTYSNLLATTNGEAIQALNQLANVDQWKTIDSKILRGETIQSILGESRTGHAIGSTEASNFLSKIEHREISNGLVKNFSNLFNRDILAAVKNPTTGESDPKVVSALQEKVDTFIKGNFQGFTGTKDFVTTGEAGRVVNNTFSDVLNDIAQGNITENTISALNGLLEEASKVSGEKSAELVNNFVKNEMKYDLTSEEGKAAVTRMTQLAADYRASYSQGLGQEYAGRYKAEEIREKYQKLNDASYLQKMSQSRNGLLSIKTHTEKNALGQDVEVENSMTMGAFTLQTAQMVNSLAMATNSIHNFRTSIQNGDVTFSNFAATLGSTGLAIGQTLNFMHNNSALIGFMGGKAGTAIAGKLGKIPGVGSAFQTKEGGLSSLGGGLIAAAAAATIYAGIKGYEIYKANTIDSKISRANEDKIQLNSLAKNDKQKYDAFLDVAKTQNENYGKLFSLQQNTTQYTSQLIESNQQARDLIDTYNLKAGTDFNIDQQGAIYFSAKQIADISERLLDQSLESSGLAQLANSRITQLDAIKNNAYGMRTVSKTKVSGGETVGGGLGVSAVTIEQKSDEEYQAELEEAEQQQKEQSALAQADYQVALQTVINSDKKVTDFERLAADILGSKVENAEGYAKELYEVAKAGGITRGITGEYLDEASLRNIYMQDEYFGEAADANMTQQELAAAIEAKAAQNILEKQIESLSNLDASAVSKYANYSSMSVNKLLEEVIRPNQDDDNYKSLNLMALNKIAGSQETLAQALFNNTNISDMNFATMADQMQQQLHLSIEQTENLANYINNFGTNFGDATGQAVLSALTGYDATTGKFGTSFNTDFYKELQNISTASSIASLADLEKRIGMVGNREVVDQMRDLQRAMREEIDSRGGLAKTLFESSDFQDTFAKLSDVFQATGHITAQNIADLAAKNETLNGYLEATASQSPMSGAQAVADIANLLASGSITTSDLTPAVAAFIEEASGTGRGSQQEAVDEAEEARKNLSDSITDTDKFYQEGGKLWYNAIKNDALLDAPMQEWFAQVLKPKDLEAINTIFNLGVGHDTDWMVKQIKTKIPEVYDMMTVLQGGTSKKKAGKGGGGLDTYLAYLGSDSFLNAAGIKIEDNGRITFPGMPEGKSFEELYKEYMDQRYPYEKTHYMTENGMYEFVNDYLLGQGMSKSQASFIATQFVGRSASSSLGTVYQRNGILAGTDKLIEQLEKENGGSVTRAGIDALYDQYAAGMAGLWINPETGKIEALSDEQLAAGQGGIDRDQFRGYIAQQLRDAGKAFIDASGLGMYGKSTDVQSIGKELADLSEGTIFGTGANAIVDAAVKYGVKRYNITGAGTIFQNGAVVDTDQGLLGQAFDYEQLQDFYTNVLGLNLETFQAHLPDIMKSLINNTGATGDYRAALNYQYKDIFGAIHNINSSDAKYWSGGEFNVEQYNQDINTEKQKSEWDDFQNQKFMEEAYNEAFKWNQEHSNQYKDPYELYQEKIAAERDRRQAAANNKVTANEANGTVDVEGNFAQEQQNQIDNLKRQREVSRANGRWDEVREFDRQIAELEGTMPSGVQTNITGQTGTLSAWDTASKEDKAGFVYSNRADAADIYNYWKQHPGMTQAQAYDDVVILGKKPELPEGETTTPETTTTPSENLPGSGPLSGEGPTVSQAEETAEQEAQAAALAAYEKEQTQAEQDAYDRWLGEGNFGSFEDFKNGTTPTTNNNYTYTRTGINHNPNIPEVVTDDQVENRAQWLMEREGLDSETARNQALAEKAEMVSAAISARNGPSDITASDIDATAGITSTYGAETEPDLTTVDGWGTNYPFLADMQSLFLSTGESLKDFGQAVAYGFGALFGGTKASADYKIPGITMNGENPWGEKTEGITDDTYNPTLGMTFGEWKAQQAQQEQQLQQAQLQQEQQRQAWQNYQDALNAETNFLTENGDFVTNPENARLAAWTAAARENPDLLGALYQNALKEGYTGDQFTQMYDYQGLHGATQSALSTAVGGIFNSGNITAQQRFDFINDTYNKALTQGTTALTPFEKQVLTMIGEIDENTGTLVEHGEEEGDAATRAKKNGQVNEEGQLVDEEGNPIEMPQGQQPSGNGGNGRDSSGDTGDWWRPGGGGNDKNKYTPFGNGIWGDSNGNYVIDNGDGTYSPFTPPNESNIVSPDSGGGYDPHQSAVACFAAGTQVLMANGNTKNIEDVLIDEIVISYDESQQKFVCNKVIKFDKHIDTIDLVQITFDNGEILKLTPSHPLYSTKGWKSLDIKKAFLAHGVVTTLLNIGDIILGINKSASVINIEKITDQQFYTTYNIDIENSHTYLVNGFIAHNKAASGQNNARLLAYASGKEGHIAVTGELGPELRVKSDGSMDILGKTGREYAWVEPDDKIYTASQSAGILKSNKIPGLEGLAKGINNFLPMYEGGKVGGIVLNGSTSSDQGSSGSSGGSGGGSGGRSRGGGGGGSSEEDPRYDPKTLKIRDVLERYYTILQQIDNITKAVERFSKVADRAWGRERIRAIEKQNEMQEKQYEAQKKYIAEIEDYLTTDQAALTTMIQEFVTGWNEAAEGKEDMEKLSWAGAEYDENGVLTNYREFVEKLTEQYNQKAASANQKDQYKFQEQLKDIQMYTDTLNLYEEQKDALEDIKNAILDTAIKAISYEVEYKLELSGDADRILNFQADKYKDDVYQAAKYLEFLDQRADLTRQNLISVQEGIFKTLGTYAGEAMRTGAKHSLEELGIYGTDQFKLDEELTDVDEDETEEARIDRLKGISTKVNEWLDQLREKNADAAAEIDKMIEHSEEEGQEDIITNYEEVIRRLNQQIDYTMVRAKVDEWLEELRSKNAEAAAEIDKIVQRNADGEIINYTDVIERLNEENVRLSDEAIALLMEDQDAFFNWMSDFKDNPGWVDFTTEHKDLLTNYMDQIYQYLESLQDTYEQTIEQLGDSIKATSKQMDAAIDEFDYYGDVYKTFGNIVDLTNRHMTDVSKDFFDSLNSRVMDNSINKIKATATNYHLLQKELEEVTRQYNEMQARADAATGEEQIYLQQSADKLKEQLDIANSQYEDVHKAFLSSWEDALSKMAENYKAAIEEASRNFEQGFSPLFNTLALLQAQFDREKALGDLYVDNYQRIHDLSKLNRDIESSILDTDNLKGKERLRDLQKEINDLQADGTELSEYDLDILDKKYKLELARQALEDAKDAKSLVRLARDNNGNWSYVYTANEDDVEKAEQDYEDAIREMEQANEDYIENIQDQIVQVQQEAQQAILALQPEDFATYDDYLAAVQAIQSSMYDTLNFLRSQMNNAFANNEYLDPYIINRYGLNDHDLTTDFEDTTLAKLLDSNNLDQSINHAKDNFENNLLRPALDAYLIYSQKQQEVYEAAEHDMATISADFGQEMRYVAEMSDNEVQIVEKLSDRVQTAFEDMAAVVDEKTQKHLAEVDELVNKYEKLVEALTEVKRLSGENLPADMMQAIDTVDTWREIEDLENKLKENGHIRLLEDLVDIDREDVIYRSDKLADATEQIDKWLESLGDSAKEIAEAVERNDAGQITNYKDIVQKLSNIEKNDDNKATLKEIKKWKEKDDKAVLMDENQALTEEGLWTYLMAGDEYTKKFLKDKIDRAAKNGAIDVGADVDETEKAKVENYLKAHGIVYVKWDGGLEKFENMDDWLAWYEKHKYVAPSGGGGDGGGDSGWAWWEHHTSDGGYIDTQGAVGYDTGGFTGRWQSADTGMYTGEWSSGSVRRNGKLAWLHQKELVLNAHDTENFLDAMKIVKQLDNLTNWMANGLGDLIMPKVTTESSELEQNVHIKAEFPNVTDHNEIEQAFNNLVNMASQYANRK